MAGLFQYICTAALTATLLLCPESTFARDTDVLEAGVAISLSDLPNRSFMSHNRSQSINGEKVAVTWHTLYPGTETSPETLDAERVFYVRSGTCRVMVSGRFVRFREHDLLRLERGAMSILEADGGSAEILEIRWPGSGEEFHPLFPMNLPMHRSYLQYLMPVDGVQLKLVQGRSGQTAFMRLQPNALIEKESLGAEQIIIVERGSMKSVIDDIETELVPGSIVRITAGMLHTLHAGPKGCDYLALLSEPRRDFSSELQDRITAFHTILPVFEQPELVVDGRYGKFQLGFSEGPNWLDGKFYFVDQKKNGVYTLDRNNALEKINDEFAPSGTALMPNGNFAVCNLTKKSIVEMSPEGRLKGILTAMYKGEAYPGIPNDIVSDSKGGLYYTIMSFAEPPDCNVLFYRTPDGIVTRVTEPGDLGIPNGCVLSPDGSILYVNDDKRDHLWAFDVMTDGALANKRPIAELIIHESVIGNKRTKSFSDGMTIDNTGNIYVCASGFVQIFDKAGIYLGGISFPKPAFHCAFGGDDGQTLYVCCMKQVYRIKTKMKGVGF